MKMMREKPDKNKKMEKEYNARGEKVYTNAIKRENAKIKKKDTASSTKGHGEGHGRKGKFFPRIIIIKII